MKKREVRFVTASPLEVAMEEVKLALQACLAATTPEEIDTAMDTTATALAAARRVLKARGSSD